MTNKIKTLIIEDEIASQNLLKIIIEDYCPMLKLKGIAGNINDGVRLLNEEDVDLVFMDINLGNETSFDLLDKVVERDFKIIFTTAHEEYALKAFRYEAVDYILKPFGPKDIITTLDRIKDKFSERRMLSKLMSISTDQKPIEHDVNRISITSSDSIEVFELENVIRLEGNGSYCHLYFKDGTKSIMSKTLKDVEATLPNHFFRSHDSHIINLNHVKQYKKLDGGSIVLTNDHEVPVSRRKKQDFVDALKSHTKEL